MDKCSAQRKRNRKTLKQKERNYFGARSRSVSLKNLVIWNQKYDDNPFLNLTFCSRFWILFYCICLLFFVTLVLLEVDNEA